MTRRCYVLSKQTMQTNNVIIPETNKYYPDIKSEDFIYIDRIYGGLNGISQLVQKDGSIYKGHLKKFKVGSQTFTLTEDARWFDNSGMPCQYPTGLNHKSLTKMKYVFDAEGKKFDEDRKWQDYKRKVFKK